jgi:hypothetical protein
VLLPATLFLMVAVPLFPAGCYLLERDPHMMELVLRLNFEIPRGAGVGVGIAAVIALPLLGIFLNRISAWIVRDPHEPARASQPMAV